MEIINSVLVKRYQLGICQSYMIRSINHIILNKNQNHEKNHLYGLCGCFISSL